MNEVRKIIKENKKIIGMWGYPDPDVFLQIRKKYPQHEIIDLDINYKTPHSNIIPDSYCRIIRNIIDNSIALKENLEIIVAAVGEEKCDAGRIAAKILLDKGFNVIQTRYNETNQCFDTPISKSNLSLKKKIITIMDNLINRYNCHPEQSRESTLLIESQQRRGRAVPFLDSASDRTDSSASPQSDNEILYVPPEYGFWGVPPNDLSILKLFPDTTHVYGWTRCVEAGCPADIDLEMFVDENVPTVFFAQTFCSKMQLAKYLAKKYNGLYVDVDDKASNSVKAKIEAFIHLG